MFERPRTGERAVLVRVGFGEQVDPEDLAEFDQLARSAGTSPVATITGRREKPDPRLFVGSGKADELRAAAAEHEADVVLVDHALSPGQERNLEKLIGKRVLDRNGLILDIFAQRARSFEGKLEVELAQLKHLASRLVRGWTHLERQKGGIGLRGPGETQLETDRRLLGRRVRVLTKRLEKLKQQRETGRRMRTEIPIPSIALVGYTNAGKSSLLRTLAGAEVLAADTLFATLDPLTRRVRLPGNETILVTDTVGFIQKLPTQLISAFRATLEELESADLLLHVVDATSPAIDAQWATVMETLDGLGLADKPMLTVLNKADGLTRTDGEPVTSEADLAHVQAVSPAPGAALLVSAVEGWGIDALRRRLAFELFGVRPELPELV